jgi:hypothetical protein
VLVKASKKWLTIAKAYCTTELNTARKKFYDTGPRNQYLTKLFRKIIFKLKQWFSLQKSVSKFMPKKFLV